jgi:hypothetical protein
MTALKFATAAAALSILFSGAPAQALMARQYAFQGQGLYTTSKGVPEGFIAIPSSEQQGYYGNSVTNAPKDMQHHGRYFGG